MKLLFKNVRWFSDLHEHRGDIRVGKGRILEMGGDLSPRRGEHCHDCTGYLATPGFINGHDHLDLNLFPRLGNPPYENFYQWGRDIYRPTESPVKDIMSVPLPDRLLWGAYKQLISGVTTVIHHDPYYRRHFDRGFPIKVLKRYGWAHSLGHSDDIAARFAASRDKPFIVHAAEGTDADSLAEIDRLDKLGLLSSNTVIVHGIAVSSTQIEMLAERNASVVWCPASNMHLYEATAPVQELVQRVRVVIGTDSTLSGSPTMWDELRAAKSTGLVDDSELIDMVTGDAARTFAIADGRGSLTTNSPADMVLTVDGGGRVQDELLGVKASSVSLVLVDGRPRLADPEWATRLGLGPAEIVIDHSPIWLQGDFVALQKRIAKVVSREILDENELWCLFDQCVLAT